MNLDRLQVHRNDVEKQGAVKNMKFNAVSRNRVPVLFLFVAFCSTTVCAGEQKKQEDRFTPKVAGSGWKKGDPATDGVMQSAALLREKLLEAHKTLWGKALT